MLEKARLEAEKIIDTDPKLLSDENQPLKAYLSLLKGKTAWSKIS
jgi:hypothetical protein